VILAQALPAAIATGCSRIQHYRCADCHAEFSVDLGTDDQEILQIAVATIPPVPRCERCAAVYEQQLRAVEFRNMMRRRIAVSGIPADCLEWDRERGNAALMAAVWHNREKSLFIGDSYGVGKTRVVCGVAGKLCEFSRVIYCNVNNVIREYAARCGESMRSADRYLDELTGADLLILDDVGKVRISSAGGDLLYSIADRACTSTLRLWVVANRSGEEIAKRFEIYDTGCAFIDRLKRICRVWNGQTKQFEDAA